MGTIVLLVTLELISPHYENINLIVNKKKLRNVTVATGIMFFLSFAYSLSNIILST